jgi:hypothetical protein
MSAAKNKVGRIINLLLVLSLLQIVTSARLSVGLQNTVASPKNTLEAPSFAGCSVSIFNLDRRSNSNSFDGPYADALISKQIQYYFIRESSSFITEYCTNFTPRTNRAAIPIRASPGRHKTNFVINA